MAPQLSVRPDHADFLPQPWTPCQVRFLALASLSPPPSSPVSPPLSTSSSLQLMKSGERPHRRRSVPSFLRRDSGSRRGRPTGEQRIGDAVNRGPVSDW